VSWSGHGLTSEEIGVRKYVGTSQLPESVNRREILRSAATLLTYPLLASSSADASAAESVPASPNPHVEYGRDTLPLGIRSRRIDNNNGITMHILEAGFEQPGRPCVVLLHGFPELAYTWRHQLLPLARAGFHVVAPDMRGYGRTAQRPVKFEDDLVPYADFSLVADVIGLTRALGHETVACVIGHDWGAPTAQWCALTRPDVFRSVVSMSNPFYESPLLPMDTADHPPVQGTHVDLQRDLAALPRPRKYYVWYYATRAANEDMWRAPQGVHDLLRAWYHFKSADFKGNRPFALKARTATEMAKMPTYYVMDLDKGAAETMAAAMPSREEAAACRWMTEADLMVYATEYSRTGFQGGLNLYRIATGPYYLPLRAFAGRKIDVPALYIGGAQDWGVRQSPGAFERMSQACTQLRGIRLIDGAGHSIPEEQPEAVNGLLRTFLKQATA
jgi:pimeloyl-ACP methyl ester carboxylesterase